MSKTTRNLVTALKLCLALMPMSIAMNGPSIAGGRVIVVTTSDGTRMRGELLSVREREILLSSAIDADERLLAERPELIRRILLSDIDSIYIRGESHVGSGIVIGGGIGIAGGLVLVAVVENDLKGKDEFSRQFGEALMLPAAGVAVFAGMLVGGIVGALTSEGEMETKRPGLEEFVSLVNASRYGKVEHVFLQRLK